MAMKGTMSLIGVGGTYGNKISVMYDIIPDGFKFPSDLHDQFDVMSSDYPFVYGEFIRRPDIGDYESLGLSSVQAELLRVSIIHYTNHTLRYSEGIVALEDYKTMSMEMVREVCYEDIINVYTKYYDNMKWFIYVEVDR